MARTPRKRTVRSVEGGVEPRGNELIDALMIRDPVTIDADVTVLAAAEVMRDSNVGMLPVLASGRLIGVITDRDLAVRATTRDVLPSEIRVGECISMPVQCAEPDWTVDEAMEEMARQRVGRLPVVDASGLVVGVVTLSSLALRSSKQAETLEAAQEVSRRSARAA